MRDGKMGWGGGERERVFVCVIRLKLRCMGFCCLFHTWHDNVAEPFLFLSFLPPPTSHFSSLLHSVFLSHCRISQPADKPDDADSKAESKIVSGKVAKGPKHSDAKGLVFVSVSHSECPSVCLLLFFQFLSLCLFISFHFLSLFFALLLLLCLSFYHVFSLSFLPIFLTIYLKKIVNRHKMGH